MTIYNLGSINADYFYRVPSIPKPGETLAAHSLSKGMGGKGANQSVALAQAGADVRHIGCIGQDGVWMRDTLSKFGVDTTGVKVVGEVSGHAIITVSDDGENAITLAAGANQKVSIPHISNCLGEISKSDWLVLQNETNGVAEAAKLAKVAGAQVAYSAAPFSIEAVSEVLDLIDLIAVNEGEAAALDEGLSSAQSAKLEKIAVLKTKGSNGADFKMNGVTKSVAGLKVEAVDTTAAGDTFFGFFLASLAEGACEEKSMELANAAAALKVTRAGTADAIPTLAEVKALAT